MSKRELRKVEVLARMKSGDLRIVDVATLAPSAVGFKMPKNYICAQRPFRVSRLGSSRLLCVSLFRLGHLLELYKVSLSAQGVDTQGGQRKCAQMKRGGIWLWLNELGHPRLATRRHIT
jgi:hypothetical protein